MQSRTVGAKNQTNDKAHPSFVRSSKTRLQINQRGDEYEQEAEKIADQILHMRQPISQPTTATTTSPMIAQRSVGGSGATAGTVPPIVQDVLASSGEPLDAATRTFFEPRFGHDFGHVRIHADATAAESARAVGALAYAGGEHIVFGRELYAPESGSGTRVLAHELTHVIQQGACRTDRFVQRATGSDPAPEKDDAPVSLAMEISGSHEIVIDGQPFELVVISTAESLKGTSAKYRSAAEEYLGSYPNLGGGLWAFIVKPGIVRLGDSPYCPIGGNCLGWANGTFDVNDPPRVRVESGTSIFRINRPDKLFGSHIRGSVSQSSKRPEVPCRCYLGLFHESHVSRTAHRQRRRSALGSVRARVSRLSRWAFPYIIPNRRWRVLGIEAEPDKVPSRA